MTMINFRPRVAVAVPAPQPVISETVTATPRPSASATHKLTDEQDWDWSHFRDYVITEIEKAHGPQPRNPKKEKAIFTSFLARYGADAMVIAKQAFEVYKGYWGNGPIAVTRFCKASDPYFADKILERIS